jgi:hypothetical protein
MERVDVPNRFLQVLAKSRVQGPYRIVPKLPGDLQVLDVHTIELMGHLSESPVPVPAHPVQDEADPVRQLGLVQRATVQESGSFFRRELGQRFAYEQVHGVDLRE